MREKLGQLWDELHRQLIKIKLSIVEQNGARGGSSSCPEAGASVVKSAGNPLSQRQERIVARSWRTAEMVRGPGPGNRRCVKFNYVIHCPCRLSNPRPPKDLPSTRRRFHRMIRRCVTQGCLRSSQQCDRGPWTLISLSTRSPRSLSTRIRQICPSIPLLFAHYSPSVPLRIASYHCSCIVWFRRKANPCTRRWLATTSKKNRCTGFFMFFLRLISKGWRAACLCVWDV